MRARVGGLAALGLPGGVREENAASAADTGWWFTGGVRRASAQAGGQVRCGVRESGRCGSGGVRRAQGEIRRRARRGWDEVCTVEGFWFTPG